MPSSCVQTNSVCSPRQGDVLSFGSTSDDRMYKELKGKVAELHVLGDAVQPREIVDAVYEAEEIAIKL